ncbi:MAG TPA: hypothetical protein VIG24_12720 [Acidimicrobiia bacterium]
MTAHTITPDQVFDLSVEELADRCTRDRLIWLIYRVPIVGREDGARREKLSAALDLQRERETQ